MAPPSRSPSYALVTGGGTGIGRAVAQALAAAGYQVTCAGLDRDEDWPGELAFERLDVTDAQALAALAARLPRLDALVNAAGIILHEGREFTAEGFRKVIDVNLTGTHVATEACSQALVRAGGAVVNVASMWSFFGSPRNPAYAASKGGVVQLTRSFAVKLAPEGVRVNAVAPGWIETRLSSGALHNPERAPAIQARIPMGRWGQPDDVADVVRFLLSRDARYVTGVVLPIDGGFGIA